MKAVCTSCNKEFDLTWGDYDLSKPSTVHVSASESAGVYDVEIECPHCHKEESIRQ